MTKTHARLIFPKSYVEHPMQTVFNAPMASDRSGERFHGREAEEEIAGLLAHLFVDLSLGAHQANALQALPLPLRVQVGQDSGIADSPVFPYFQSPMTLFDKANRWLWQVCPPVFLGECKGRLDFLIQVPLVVFERKGVVALLLDN